MEEWSIWHCYYVIITIVIFFQVWEYFYVDKYNNFIGDFYMSIWKAKLINLINFLNVSISLTTQLINVQCLKEKE